VNDFLRQLLARQQAILRKSWVGLYLGGSLALGDFNPDRSDIDFVAVTVDQLPAEVIGQLANMHSELRASGSKWATRLDGSYIPQQVLRHWTADHPPCPFVEGDRFQVTRQGSAVIQRHIIREHGVTVSGPPPHDLLDLVSAEEQLGALQGLLTNWWRLQLDNPAWVAQIQNQPFAILTMCRSLYVLEHGDVASKVVAGRWAQKAIGQPWVESINWALAWPHDPESDYAAAALSLIEYTVNRFRQHD
jgi:hypothetical protein